MTLQVLALFSISGAAVVWFLWDELRRRRAAVSTQAQGPIRVARDPELNPDQRLLPVPLPVRSSAQSEAERAFLENLTKINAGA